MKKWEKTLVDRGLRPCQPVNLKNIDLNTKVDFIDNDGYMYTLSKNLIVSAAFKNSKFARFFKGNPHTEHNINIYLADISGGDVCIEKFESKCGSDKILLRSKSSGRTYFRTWNRIFLGFYYIPKTKEYFYHPHLSVQLDEIKGLWKEKFDATVLSEEFINGARRITFVCNKHPDFGEQSVSPSAVKDCQTICRRCARDLMNATRHRKAEAKFWDGLDSVKNPNIVVLGKYDAAAKKIRCLCLKCGTECLLNTRFIRDGLGHRGCNRSIGEIMVAQWLTELGIKYTPEYVFDDCKMKRYPMPFDFYLPDYNTVIEVDGRQHYESVPFFGGDLGLEQVQQRDAFKTAYCNEHGISIIRIPYYDLPDVEKCVALLSSIKCA